jgi:Arc/MetJ family transcription regulator
LPSVMGQFQKTNVRLDAKLIQAALQRHQARTKKVQGKFTRIFPRN